MTHWLIEFTRSRVKKTLVHVHDLHFHANNNILFANYTYLQYPNTDPEGLFLTTVSYLGVLLLFTCTFMNTENHSIIY